MASSGWNKPTGSAKPAPKKPTALKGALVGGILVAAICAALYFIFSGGDAPEAKVEKKRARIKEQRPVVVPKPVEAEANETESTPRPAAKPAKKKPTQPPGYQRVMTLMDGTVVTNRTRAVFKRPLENFLAAAAMRPNGTGRTLLTALWQQHGDTAFLEMLKEMTVPEEGDSDAVRQIKENVQKLKESILLEVANGRSLESIFSEISHNNSMDRMVNAQTIHMQSEAIRSGDAEAVRAATETVNKLRRDRGLADLEVPRRFRQDDDWGTVVEDVPAEPEAEAESEADPEEESDLQEAEAQ